MTTITIDRTDEQELVIKAREKDEQAFEALIKLYETDIYNYIVRMTRNTINAMDILQETVIRVFTNLERYDMQYSFKNWFYRLAKNTIIDETRKKNYKLQKNSSSLDGSIIQAVDPHCAYDTPEHNSLKEALTEAINKLPEKLRSIITLADILELSYEEAAEIENINIGTVKSRLNRARNSLKNMKHLKEYL